MQGLDEVGLTLARDTQISAYEAKVAGERPWLAAA
jgi:3-isopropylmalate/(R)-2-methylmalate dehydratase small subunit